MLKKIDEIQEQISKYAVKIKYTGYKKGRLGSGVLVKRESNVYVITAKHNFKKKDDDKHTDVKIKKLKKDASSKIDILDGKDTKICKIEELLYADEELDIAVFSTKDYTKKLDMIEMLTDNRYKNQEHIFYGFPNGEENWIRELTYNGKDKKNKNEKNNFSLSYSHTMISEEDFSGYSGSGVFVENNSIYYLVGIMIRAFRKSNSFTAVDLRKVYKKIDEVLKEKKLPLLDSKINYNIEKEEININEEDKIVFETTNIKTDNFDINIAVNPVTYHDYDIFCKNKNRKKAKRYFLDGEQGHYPVVYVSWDDANSYCEWLSEVSKKQYTLPSEEEWEYIANENLHDSGLEDDNIWYENNTGKTLINIEENQKGKLGIYDMLGNIYEWCVDSCNGKGRIAKGGSFRDRIEDINIEKMVCLLAFDNDKSDLGFRVINKRPMPNKLREKMSILSSLRKKRKNMEEMEEELEKEILNLIEKEKN